MIEFFKAALDFFGMIIHFLEFLLKGIAQLLLLIPQAAGMLMYSIGYLPSVVLAFAAVAITLSIVFLLVNRR